MCHLDKPVELRALTRENFMDCLNLDVREDQRSFVASNVFSIAQAYIERDTAEPLVIYAGGVPVGFSLLTYDAEKGERWICRLMIDKRYQGKGFGKAALACILGRLKERGETEVRLSFEPENTAARTLYSGSGFAETGEVDEGEIVMRRTV